MSWIFLSQGNFWVLFWNILALACIVHQISSPFCLRFWKMQQRVNGSSDAWWCMVLCPQGASYDPGLLTQFFQQFSKESADSGSDLFVRLRLILYSCKIVYMIYLYLIYLGVECFILIMCIILWFLVISSWYGSMAAVLNRRLDFFRIRSTWMFVVMLAILIVLWVDDTASQLLGDHGYSLTST